MSLCAIRPCQNEVASDKTFGSGSLEGVSCASILLRKQEVGTNDIECKSRDPKGICKFIHINIHGRLGPKERRVFIIDIPTMERVIADPYFEFSTRWERLSCLNRTF